MKKNHKLNCAHDYNFVALAINSHCKAYKLCWMINRISGMNFEKTDDHQINNDLFFARFHSKNANGESFNLISNRSKKGFMIPSHKSVNYFLIVNKEAWHYEKDEILSGLREINDILLVFEFDLEKEKDSERFVIYDKKN